MSTRTRNRRRTSTRASAGGQMALRATRGPDDQGASLADLVLTLALGLSLAATSLPTVAAAIDANRVRQASSFMAARVRGTRLDAIHAGRGTGLAFDQLNGRWTFRFCVDGNDNGVRRAEISTGTDPCPDGPQHLPDLFPGVSIAVDSSIPTPDGGPPSPSPVRVGSSRLVSFTPDGTATSGSVYVRSPAGVQYALRFSGVTGRLRILRYDAPARRWTSGS